MKKLPRSPSIRYGASVLMVFAVLLLRHYVGTQPAGLAFVLAVVLAAWCFGIGPGIVTAVSAAVATGWAAPKDRVLAFVTSALLGILLLAIVRVLVKIYEGHGQTEDAMLALKQSLEERDLKLSISEENLQNETRIQKAILNCMGDGVVVADANNKFLVFNPAAKALLGQSPDGSGVNRWSEHYGFYLPDTFTLYPSKDLPLAKALRGLASDDVEIFTRNENIPNGGWRSVTARPLIDERGVCRGGVAIYRDISEAKRIHQTLEQAKETAERANQAKSEFLSRMSHELRTPLNSILGFAQILELEQLPSKQRESVEYILKGGEHLLGLINEVLDIARIETGRISFSPESVRVSDALGEALELIRPLAQKRNVLIDFGRAVECSRHVLADRQKLTQVLLNLLSNAVKYNRDGGSVVVSCHGTSSGRLRVNIADSGPGITPENLGKLFQPFERLDAEQSGIEGSGLGLALSKRLLEAMGGAIGVESTPGEGSTFWLELSPMADPVEAAQEQSEPSLPALQAATASGAAKLLLYIEDNLSNLRLMEHIVANRPHIELLAAMQGQLGLELAQEHHPDLILLDLHLPDLRGDQVLQQLRQDPRTRSIPVVMVSADGTPGQIERLRAAGANDYITKPLDVRKFLQMLDQTLKTAPAAPTAAVEEADQGLSAVISVEPSSVEPSDDPVTEGSLAFS